MNSESLFIKKFSWSIFLLVIILSLNCSPKDNRNLENISPNIILILADDLGWGDLSINGNTTLSTPNIDGMARNGIVMENFFVSPVCSPTRAEILTGRYSPRTGVYSTSAGGERMDLDETTIADILRADGYATAAFGKWHNGMQYPYHPNGRGFDEFYGFCSGHWGNYFSPMLEHNGQIVKGNGYIINDFTDRAIDYIQQHKDNPFFLYLLFNTPHSPMQVPDRWYEKFKNIPIVQAGTEEGKENIEHTKAALAMCENIDWNVGRVLNKLKDLKIEEETIVMFLSDNGPNGHRWNGEMKGIKGSTDEGGVKSPLIIQWKDLFKGGKRVKEITSSIDIFPTLKEISNATLESNNPVDGKSLMPLLLGKNEEWPERYIYSYWNDKLSVRSQNFRLDNDNRLYDMENDIGQTEDVSESHPVIKGNLQNAKSIYRNEVLSELAESDYRKFTVGHSDYKITQLPARDGKAHGTIQRSNQWPNCSFYTNWTNIDDKITWDISILESGEYDVSIYYTLSDGNEGTIISLQYADAIISREIKQSHDPDLRGMENDRGDPRAESYVKDFRPLNLGRIYMEKSKGVLTLRADDIPGKQSIDFRLLMIEKV